MVSSLSDNDNEAGSDTELIPSSPVSPDPVQPPLKTRVIIFFLAVTGIFAEFLYFTVPTSFLTNEILEVLLIGRGFFFAAHRKLLLLFFVERGL